jgi:hypothetical protein
MGQKSMTRGAGPSKWTAQPMTMCRERDQPRNSTSGQVLVCLLLVCFLFCFILFLSRVSLCSPGWPGTHNPPASESKVLEL